MYLNCKTYHSYRYGTFSAEQLVDTAAQLEVKSLALTNVNGTPDVWDFVQFCHAKNIKPIVGCEIRNDQKFCYLLLARNANGFTQINQFLTDQFQKDLKFPTRPVFDKDVFVVYELAGHDFTLLRDNELIGVKPSEVNKLLRLPIGDHLNKFVIRHPVTVQNKLYHNLHRLLRAVDLNTLLTKLTPNDYAGLDEVFIPEGEIHKKFEAYPEIIKRTEQVVQACGIDFDFNGDKNADTFGDSKEADHQLLRKLAFEGIFERYGEPRQEIIDRVEKELKVIQELNFNTFYLTVWDVIIYARSRNFYYVGRGSGANSIVAYALKITEVDPIKLDLYFERFLNEFRSSPPDFDIDFSHKDRDEIIAYIFNKYGKDHVSLLGMYSTFKHRAIIRELGKVLGLPKAEIDALAGTRKISFAEDSIQKKILKYGDMMRSFPNHHSIHAGGILISAKPICTYTALQLPPKGFATAQIDMFVADKIRLHKLDILSQRGLGHIKDTIEIVKQNRGISIDISKTDEFMKDELVKKNIREANTIGCFYIESPAMRQLLLKLKCADYLTLVAASSIIRPGVSQSGMMKQYIYNYHHPDEVKYLHPKMEELLKETYGVMVYQEDVIKVAHHYAGLDMAEADILRRAMSGKYRGSKEMDRLEIKFFKNCLEKGYPETISREVWRQISSFAGYSFSKAHSASFAVESYQSLYLKTYFPMEFMVAVINNFGGFYRTQFYFHELKKAGATIHPPCVNNSKIYTSISGTDVFVGFVHIEKFTESLRDKLIHERDHFGLFTDLENFIERVQPGMEQLNILIRVGAVRFTGIDKKNLLWKANFMQKQMKEVPAMKALFQEPQIEFSLPQFTQYPLEDAFDEIEILGFALNNAFDLCDHNLQHITYAKDLSKMPKGEITVIGQLVTTKDSYTKRNEHMLFGTFLDPSGDWLDTVHWPASISKYPLSGSGFYKMKGKVMQDFGVFAVEVHWLEKIGYKQINQF